MKIFGRYLPVVREDSGMVNRIHSSHSCGSGSGHFVILEISTVSRSISGGSLVPVRGALAAAGTVVALILEVFRRRAIEQRLLFDDDSDMAV